MKRTRIKPRVHDIPVEPYAYFVSCKEQIALWLKNGFTMKSVWLAYKKAEPPFPGSYSIFRRYCAKHDLVVRDARLHSSEPRSKESEKQAVKEPLAAAEVDIEKYRNRYDFSPNRSKKS
ncbi:MAG: hypothetical protein WBG86_14955 [Polyangiales bacterium]